MIAENPLPEQLDAIGWALATGALLGAAYELMRLLRRCTQRAGLTFALDLLFSLCGSAAVFLLVTSAAQTRLRGFLLAALAGGWLAWDRTAGRAIRRAANALGKRRRRPGNRKKPKNRKK